MANYGHSDCHLAPVIDDPNDISPTAKRPMCTFCGKTWCEVLRQPVGMPQTTEIILRRWKDGDIGFGEVIANIEDIQQLAWYRVFNKVERNLKKRKKPMYLYDHNTMEWKPDTNKQDKKSL